MTDRLLTVPEVADYLRVKPRTVYQWVWRRRIPFVKAGATVRFRRAEIDDWLARRNRKETRLAPASKPR
jgi:excisionase family DNA binding protein